MIRKILTVFLSFMIVFGGFSGLSVKAAENSYSVPSGKVTEDSTAGGGNVRLYGDKDLGISFGYNVHLLKDGKSIRVFTGTSSSETIRDAEISRDGNYVAYITYAYKAFVYNVTTQETKQIDNKNYVDLEFSRDSTKLALAGQNHGLIVYDLETESTQITPSNRIASNMDSVRKVLFDGGSSDSVFLYIRSTASVNHLYHYNFVQDEVSPFIMYKNPVHVDDQGRLYTWEMENAYDEVIRFTFDESDPTYKTFTKELLKKHPTRLSTFKSFTSSDSGDVYTIDNVLYVEDLRTTFNAFSSTNAKVSTNGRYLTNGLTYYDISDIVDNTPLIKKPTTPVFSRTELVRDILNISASMDLTTSNMYLYKDGVLVKEGKGISYTEVGVEHGKESLYQLYSALYSSEIQDYILSEPVEFVLNYPKGREVLLGSKTVHVGDRVVFGGKNFRVAGDNLLIAESGQFTEAISVPSTTRGTSDVISPIMSTVSSSYYNTLDEIDKQTIEFGRFPIEEYDGTPMKTTYSYLGLPTQSLMESLHFTVGSTPLWTYNEAGRTNLKKISTNTYSYTTSSSEKISPLIQLKSNAKVLDGDGSGFNPYFIKGLGEAPPDIVPPRDFKAGEVTSTEVILSWEHPKDNLVYELKRNGVVVYSGAGKGFKDTGLSPSSTVVYSLTATDGVNVSTPVTLTLTTKEPEVPLYLDAPENLKVIGITEDSLTLVWDKVENSTGYIIKRDGIELTQVDSEIFINYGLESNKSYLYEVIAINDGGLKSPPAPIMGTTNRVVVDYPTGFKVDYLSHDSVRLVWGPVSNADSYSIFRDGILVYSGTDLSYTDTNLQDNITVVYTLIAHNGNVQSTPVEKVVNIPKAPEVGEKPQGASVLKVSRVYFDRVNLQWTSVTGATYYNLFRDDESLVYSGTLNVATDMTVSDLTSYTYKVVAGNDYGHTTSQPVVVTTPAEPISIVINPSPPMEGTITFDFKIVEGAVHYVERNPQTKYTPIGNGQYQKTYYNEATGELKDQGVVSAVDGKLSFSETGVNPGQDYHYSVIAVVTNSDGAEEVIADTEVTVTTPSDGSGVTVPGDTNEGGNTPGDGGTDPEGGNRPGTGEGTDPGIGEGTPPGDGGSTPGEGDGGTTPGTGNGGSTPGTGGSTPGGSGGSVGGGGGGSTVGGNDSDKEDTNSTKPNDSENDNPNQTDEDTPEEIAGVEFKDDIPTFSKEAVKYLTSKGIIVGYEDGTFKGNKEVTRAEFAVMLAKALNPEVDSTYRGNFKDFDKNSWYSEWLATSLNAQITKGFTDGYYRPNLNIPREQAAVMVSNVVGNRNAEPAKFSDYDKIVAWAKESVNAASDLGIIVGYPDNTYQPKKVVTRSEAAVIVYKLLNIVEE